MKTRMMMIASLVNALAGVLFLIGEKWALAVVFFTLAVVMLAASRHATGGSDPPKKKRGRSSIRHYVLSSCVPFSFHFLFWLFAE